MEPLSDIIDLNSELIYKTATNNDMDGLKKLFTLLGPEEVFELSITRAYEKLKLLNIYLEDDMENFLVNAIIASKFFTKRDKENQKDVIVTAEDILKRIEMVINAIDWLLTPDKPANQIMDLFVYKCTMIAKHLYILKYFLKNSYDKIPWTEMEFCILAFVSSVARSKNSDDIYNLVLDKERLLSHFNNFKMALVKLMQEPENITVVSKMKLYNRNEKIESVKKYYPGFESLYKDYDLIKDVYSLKRIEYYISVCRKLDFDQNKKSDALIIERTLQVVGESLKDTLESPNISRQVQDLLLKSAPKNLIETITTLRVSLSHTDYLIKKTEIEKNYTRNYFKSIQDDLEKIRVEISNILYQRKLCAFAVFARKVLNCDNLDKIRNLATGVEHVSFEETSLTETYLKDLDDLKTELDILEMEIDGIMPQEQELLEKIKQNVDSHESKLKKSLRNYRSLTDAMNISFHCMKKYDDIKLVQRLFVLILEVLSSLLNNQPLQKTISLIWKLRSNLRIRLGVDYTTSKLEEIFTEISDIMMLRFERVSDIARFKSVLEKTNDTAVEHEKYTDSVLDKIETFIENENRKISFNNARKNKKEIYEIRLKILRLLETQPYNTESNRLPDELIKPLKLKKKNQTTFLKDYKDGKLDLCKGFINKIDDYGLFLKNLVQLDIFSLEKQEKALKQFLASLNLKDFPIDNIVKAFGNDNRNQIQEFYKNRLHILKSLLPNENATDALAVIKKLEENDTTKVLVEQVLLDLMNVMEKASLFVDNKLFLDECPPVLLGKSLRNYLAHGNFLIDVLPYCPSKSIACNALKLITEGESLLGRKDVLIGKKISSEYFKTESSIDSKGLLYLQNVFFSLGKKSDIHSLIGLTNYGPSCQGRDIYGRDILYYATLGDNLEVFQYFLTNDSDILRKDCNGTNILAVAVESGSFKILHYCLDELKIGLTPDLLLFLSTYYGDKETIDKLLSDSSSVKEVLSIAVTNGYKDIIDACLTKYSKEEYLQITDALHVACLNGHIEIVEALLSAGFDVNSTIEDDVTPLHFAVLKGNKDLVELLLKYHAEIKEDTSQNTNVKPTIHEKSSDKNISAAKSTLLMMGSLELENDETTMISPMHLACILGYEDVFRVLFKYGGNIDSTYRGVFKLAHTAVISGEVGILKILLKETNIRIDEAIIDGLTPLHLAVIHGFEDCVDVLLENKANINKKSTDGFKALHYACQYGQQKIFEKLLALDKNIFDKDEDRNKLVYLIAEFGRTELLRFLPDGISFNITSYEGYTPLTIAVQNGHANMVELLLERGANANLSDCDRNTALHYAAYLGFSDIVKILFENNAEVNVTNLSGVTPLMYALESNFNDIAEVLIAKSADVNLFNPDHLSPLHLACKSNSQSVIDLLIKSGARVNASGASKATPLHLACAYGNKLLVESLLKAGAEINAATLRGFTPLYLAVKNSYIDIIENLLQNGANVNQSDDSLITPLHHACRSGHLTAAEILLANRANPFARDAGGALPIHQAALNGHLELVKLLSKQGPSLNEATDNGETLLHLAAESGNTNLVEYLIENGAKVDAQDEELFIPLHVAAQNKHVAVVELLLDAGSEVNARSESGLTALFMAVDDGSLEVADTLLKRGAQVDVTESLSLNSPLHVAIEKGHKDVAHLLVEFASSIDIQNESGYSPLHEAVILGQVDITERLLLKGASVNITDCEDKTPLHYACDCEDENEHRDDYVKIVDMLLKNGASPLLIDEFGRTPLDEALSLGCEAIVNLLLSKSGNQHE